MTLLLISCHHSVPCCNPARRPCGRLEEKSDDHDVSWLAQRYTADGYRHGRLQVGGF